MEMREEGEGAGGEGRKKKGRRRVGRKKKVKREGREGRVRGKEEGKEGGRENYLQKQPQSFRFLHPLHLASSHQEVESLGVMIT